MNILKDRPNLLFLVFLRNQNKNCLVIPKLRRAIYLLKMIKALTVIKIYDKECTIGEMRFVAGGKAYYLNGKFHRADGPAVIWPDGYQVYYINGKRHRVNGPAIIAPNGYQAYWLNGKRHRADGPAIIYVNGYEEYCINGECVDPF
jgi:hypothetical protein